MATILDPRYKQYGFTNYQNYTNAVSLLKAELCEKFKCGAASKNDHEGSSNSATIDVDKSSSKTTGNFNCVPTSIVLGPPSNLLYMLSV